MMQIPQFVQGQAAVLGATGWPTVMQAARHALRDNALSTLLCNTIGAVMQHTTISW